ncbi:MAG: hypothetical protein IPH07_08160 [Deltaproteobacteria bacterium]|nr:hypothetical protein [Deltaproteobacteria bacterium]MBK8236714.1 hypothetical protein [Deltaproteobacteria bacterium]MBK8720006.1 hypothetical protein [Deltaproteobacteria bacterium]MBP7288710.1 hypothetical protein [Nannocystaceae bacterium]
MRLRHRTSPSLRPSLLIVALSLACTGPSANIDDGSSDGGGSSSTGASTSLTTTTASTTASDSSGDGSSGGPITTTATTDPGSSSDSGPLPGECGAQAACSAPAPSGWFGPTIYARVTEAGDLPACPAEYAEPGPTVLEGYHDPGPALCDCECDYGVAPSCYGYKYSHTTAACNSYLDYAQVSETCMNTNVAGFASFYAYLQNSPSCMQNKVEEIPPVEWDATVRSCKLQGPATSCEEGAGVCTPLPPSDFEANLCVYKQGDEACPPGEYSVKRSYYSNIEDSRDCSSCSCGAAVATCEAVMEVYADLDCAGDVASAVPNNACTPATGSSVAMALDTGLGCTVASAPEATGEVAPTGQFTFCCQG